MIAAAHQNSGAQGPRTVLTGVKSTGLPHLGNYVGAIRPAIEMSRAPGTRNFFFVADYHALIGMPDSASLRRSTHEVAATWLACGLDPDQVVLYRQSDIPEILELSWILTCFTAKGLMNRAHAYKAAVDENKAAGRSDLDHEVTTGLYTYPILMTADILMLKGQQVPVGKDQVQHIEIARDIAQRFNHHYKTKVLVLPEAVIGKDRELLTGLDGRKMSKSYDNHVPLFLPAAQLRKKIMQIKTDSTPPEAPKDPDTSAIFQIYREFATEAEIAALRERYSKGIGWGHAKEELFNVLDRVLSPMRAKYDALMADTSVIDAHLKRGADRARAIATPYLAEIRRTIGL